MLFRRPLCTLELTSFEGGGQRGLGLCRERPVLGITSWWWASNQTKKEDRRTGDVQYRYLKGCLETNG